MKRKCHSCHTKQSIDLDKKGRGKCKVCGLVYNDLYQKTYWKKKALLDKPRKKLPSSLKKFLRAA